MFGTHSRATHAEGYHAGQHAHAHPGHPSPGLNLHGSLNVTFTCRITRRPCSTWPPGTARQLGAWSLGQARVRMLDGECLILTSSRASHHK
jgi:hypothetical protein